MIRGELVPVLCFSRFKACPCTLTLAAMHELRRERDREVGREEVKGRGSKRERGRKRGRER